MKIAIISINMYPKKLNFACPLHTYSFQQFLLKNGIDCTILDYKPRYFNNFDLRHPADYYERIINTKKNKNLNYEYEMAEYEKYKNSYHEREVRYDKFKNFIDKNYKKTDESYDSDLLEVMDPGFDCYICATDVIWKFDEKYGFERGFFLGSSCIENKWKISYASSRNVKIATDPSDINQFFHYVKDIDFISVREDSLKKYIEENTDREVVSVIDPVLLHDKEFYEKILIKPKEKNYLLLYHVIEKGSATLKYAVEYAKKHNLKIIELNDEPCGEITDADGVDYEFKYDVGVEEWLGYLYYADTIFTNSFHCSCFGILFEKNFFVGPRGGDKVQHVLKKFGLSDRICTPDGEYLNKGIKDIDFVKVRRKLKKYRKESSDFILNVLNEIKYKKKEYKDYSIEKKKLEYKVYYYSTLKKNVKWKENVIPIEGEFKKLSGGAVEFRPTIENGKNDGKTCLFKNPFLCENQRFIGYNIRFRIEDRTFWCLANGKYADISTYDEEKDGPLKLFKPHDKIPYLPVNKISVLVVTAVWKEIKNTKFNKIVKMLKKGPRHVFRTIKKKFLK